MISQLPKVQLEPNQSVTVSQLPSVNLAEGQQVAVTELPRVKLETGQAVRVYTTTPMLSKPVGGESMATSLLTITEGMAELNVTLSHFIESQLNQQ
ncbi:hypothetical protein [Photobacterium gaetbulicola]|uniref:hypothetical protein n=1 Tax=Photobacterium gaetbulicola TaxID=1295392 RepID=UPI0011B217A1|nr:hypothetical protein [Photobacterium gaetbulicola]